MQYTNNQFSRWISARTEAHEHGIHASIIIISFSLQNIFTQYFCATIFFVFVSLLLLFDDAAGFAVAADNVLRFARKAMYHKKRLTSFAASVDVAIAAISASILNNREKKKKLITLIKFSGLN